MICAIRHEPRHPIGLTHDPTTQRNRNPAGSKLPRLIGFVKWSTSLICRHGPCTTKTRADWNSRADAEASPSTMRTFTSSDHRRCLPVSTISRRLIGRLSVGQGISEEPSRYQNSTCRICPRNLYSNAAYSLINTPRLLGRAIVHFSTIRDAFLEICSLIPTRSSYATCGGVPRLTRREFLGDQGITPSGHLNCNGRCTIRNGDKIDAYEDQQRGAPLKML